MNGTPFKLGTFARHTGGVFAAIVLGDSDVIDLRNTRTGALTTTESIEGLLEDWDVNFVALQENVARIEKEGRPGALKLSNLKVLPPVRQPGKMFYAAQNFQEHVDEMLRAGMTPKEGPKFTGEKSTSAPYLFLKAPSTLAGAYDDIAIPAGLKKIDWEAEIACVIAKPGKHIKAERALDHVAGLEKRAGALPHPAAGPATEHIAALEREKVGGIFDLLLGRENELRGVAVLFDLAVHHQPDEQLHVIADEGARN